MAAIYPHVETDDVTPLEADYFACSAGPTLAGLGRRCPTPEEVISQHHQNIAWLATTRQVVMAQVDRVRISLVGTAANPRVEASEMLYGPEWNGGYAQSGALLTETTKMNAPSFSLPAGTPVMGGSCPAATAGQSIVPLATMRRAARSVSELTGRKLDTLWLSDSICGSCYALIGNYRYANKNIADALVLEWTRRALQDGSFIPTMIEVIDNAAYWPEAAHNAEARFFRIHDAGDFFSPAYLRAWFEIAKAFLPGNLDGYEPIQFWAPTRMWISKAIRDLGAEAPQNFSLRPSSYHINDRAPTVRGWAKGTVVISPGKLDQAERKRLYTFNCGAYSQTAADEHNCLSALDPDGNPGCRACWTHRRLTVNYTLHGSRHHE